MRNIHQAIFKVVDAALTAGYRHIDTAVAYNNHQSLARALAVLLPEQNLTRQDIFIYIVLYCTVLYCTVLYCTVLSTTSPGRTSSSQARSLSGTRTPAGPVLLTATGACR